MAGNGSGARACFRSLIPHPFPDPAVAVPRSRLPYAPFALSNRRYLIRDLHAGDHLDLFIVSAVSTVLVIRFALYLSGYPQIGGARLHIAHMLWGGMLMLAGLVCLLAYLGRRPRMLGAILGGIGFGTFIDELGKFVTRDHDYFYRPAVALIYGTFVVTYLASRAILRRARTTREEYVVNALQEVEQAVLSDLQGEERDRALRYLDRAGPDAPLARDLTAVLRTSTIIERAPGPFYRVRSTLLDTYRRIALSPRFEKGLVVFFVGQLLVKIVQVLMLVFRPDSAGLSAASFSLVGVGADAYSTAEWLQLSSSLLAAAFTAIGIWWVPRSRRHAYRWFERSILVSIFLTQVFMFYREQWSGLVALAFNLVVLGALRFIAERQRATG